MSYRFRKYSFMAVRYVIFISLCVYLVVEGAHRKTLPAFMEFYAGDVIRKATKKFYRETKLTASSRKSKGRFFWDALDWLTREPGSLYANDMLNRIDQSMMEGYEARRSALKQLISSPAITGWIQGDNPQFAEVYEFEAVDQIEKYPWIGDFAIRNLSGKILKEKGSTTLPEKKSEYKADHKGFSIQIKNRDKIIGYMTGKWLPWNFPEFQTMAGSNGVNIILLNSEGEILNPDVAQSVPEQWLQESPLAYAGPFGGYEEGTRITSAELGILRAVVLWPVADVSLYIFRLMMLAAIIGLCAGSFYYAKLMMQQRVWKEIFPPGNWEETALEESFQFHSESMELVSRISQGVIHLREAESARMETVARSVTSVFRQLHQMQKNEAVDSHPVLNESSVNVFTENEITDEPLDFEIKQVLKKSEINDKNQTDHPSPQIKSILPPPEILSDEISDIEIIDEMEHTKSKKIIQNKPEAAMPAIPEKDENLKKQESSEKNHKSETSENKNEELWLEENLDRKELEVSPYRRLDLDISLQDMDFPGIIGGVRASDNSTQEELSDVKPVLYRDESAENPDEAEMQSKTEVSSEPEKIKEKKKDWVDPEEFLPDEVKN